MQKNATLLEQGTAPGQLALSNGHESSILSDKKAKHHRLIFSMKV